MNDYVAFIVTYNRPERIQYTIEALTSQDISPRILFVIDNGNSNQTFNIIKKYLGKKVVYIRTGENLGHGGGLAIGMKKYLNEYYYDEFIMLFEDDSVPSKRLSKYMLDHILNKEFDMIALDGFMIKTGKRVKPVLNTLKPVSIDFALLDGCVFHSSLLKKAGIPVSNWFMMYDDIEFSYRIRKAGFKIGAVKNIYHQIEHLGAKSSAWRAYYQTRNHLHFVRMYPTIDNLIDFILLEGKRIIGGLGT
jgi:GT2 family glycosyltransferase